MKNIYSVIWSEEAAENLSKILLYLEENWTEKEIRKFASKLEKLISIIESQHDSFPKAAKVDVRKAVLTRQVTLYYNVRIDVIRIITLFDSRQNPEKLKL